MKTERTAEDAATTNASGDPAKMRPPATAPAKTTAINAMSHDGAPRVLIKPSL
ncbi:MAG: hypothetical protein AB7F76_07280 [Parvibaculaceae bacterium]